MSLPSRLSRWMRKRGARAATLRAAPEDDVPSRLWDLLHDGAQRLASEDLPGAVACFSKALDLKADCGQAHRGLGQAYRGLGRLEDAADELALACHFEPVNADVHAQFASVLRALGRFEEAETACCRASALAPWMPEAAFERANLAKSRGDPAAAIAGYREALRLEPNFVPALCNLGNVLRGVGRFAEAQCELERALECDPRLPEAHHNLGLALREQGEFARALACFERAFELNPALVATQSCIAHCLADLGRTEEAVAVYDAVLARQPNFGDAVINRCYALLQKGDFKAGWAAYEHRFDATNTSARSFPYTQWRGEPLEGLGLLVYAEQGLGDELMFASCLPELLDQAASCVIECSTRVAPLFRRSFPRAVVHGGAKSDSMDWLAGMPRIDRQCPIGGLPRYLRESLESFPSAKGYLRADATRTDYWRARLAQFGNEPKIGISWRGGTHATRGLLRSTKLNLLAAALEPARAVLVSLQYGDCAAEIAQLRDEGKREIHDVLNGNEDMDEHAALISALDLVVSVDNTAVHLAGALGRAVWVLLHASPEWRYPRSGSSFAWYPSARLFHQRRAGVWESVLPELSAALAEWRNSRAS